jgi:hypothetical protein
MPMYRFALHHRADETEKLGIMELLDDTEALAFAKRMIEDMADNDRTQCDGCAVGITDGKRTVGRISCDAGPGP